MRKTVGSAASLTLVSIFKNRSVTAYNNHKCSVATNVFETFVSSKPEYVFQMLYFCLFYD